MVCLILRPPYKALRNESWIAADLDGGTDSTMGKLMQKAGGIFGHKGMKDKGQAKREAAGYGEDLKDTDAPDGDGEAAESLRARDVEGLAEADR